MIIDVHQRIGDIDADAWDSVVEACGAPVFYRHRFLRAYEQAPLQPLHGHAYLVAHDDPGRRRPAAVLPLYLQRPADPVGALGRCGIPVAAADLALLTHAWHCYDTWIPACRPGEELIGAVLGTARTLAADLGAGWFGLVNLDAGRRLTGVLRSIGCGPGDHVDERFWLDLTPFGDLDDYVASLRPRVRANLRRYLRRAAESGLAVQVLEPAAADLDGIVSLARLTAQRHGAASFYPDGSFQQFVRALGPAARVIELRMRDRLIAAGVCLLDAERFHTWTCGVDYRPRTSFSPYYLLFIESVRAAFASGRRRLEGGRRNGRFKLRHGMRRCALAAFVTRPRTGGDGWTALGR